MTNFHLLGGPVTSTRDKKETTPWSLLRRTVPIMNSFTEFFLLFILFFCGLPVLKEYLLLLLLRSNSFKLKRLPIS